MTGADDAADADTDALELRPSLVTAAGPGRGYRNFLVQTAKPPRAGDEATSSPLKVEYFAGGSDGLFEHDGSITNEGRARLRTRMARIARSFRTITAQSGTPNPGIPSGYAYLLQFIAHDMVDSTASWSAGPNGLEFVVTNARATPLCLDTIYGPGPGALPHVYAPSPPSRLRPDVAPRTRLRLGKLLASPPEAGSMNLRRDIARAVDSIDFVPARTPPEAMPWRTAPLKVRSIPLVADARNDSHALISQLTALFHAFHNCVMDLVDRGSLTGKTEEIIRGFLYARTAVTLIYREIILRDVLPRILHKSVEDIYLGSGGPRFDLLQDTDEGIPVEFSHGAFRFAHAMSRRTYFVNAQNPEGPFSSAFTQTSARQKTFTPVTAAWHVDWSRFFFDADRLSPADREQVNFSNLLGPAYPIDVEMGLDPKDETNTSGLAYRDLMSASFARCWSVKPLVDQMRTRPIWRDIVPPYDGRFKQKVASLVELMDERETVEDPPLPLFILCEAKLASAGLCLGPVGSILVAETILGAIKRNPIKGVNAGPLALRLRECAETLLVPGQGAGLAPLIAANIDTMPKLLRFLDDQAVFTT